MALNCMVYYNALRLAFHKPILDYSVHTAEYKSG